LKLEKEKTLKAKKKEKDAKQKLKDTEKEKIKAKEKEDELKPKRTRSAFSFFVGENFKPIKEINPKKTAPEITKLISEKWNASNENVRKPFLELAVQDKERYAKEMAQYIKTLPPKRPATGFILFCNEIRPAIKSKNPSLAMPAISKLLGEQWRKLTESDKKKYLTTSSKLLEEYHKKAQKAK